jgi:hypothetical protein
MSGCCRQSVGCECQVEIWQFVSCEHDCDDDVVFELEPDPVNEGICVELQRIDIAAVEPCGRSGTDRGGCCFPACIRICPTSQTELFTVTIPQNVVRVIDELLSER